MDVNLTRLTTTESKTEAGRTRLAKIAELSRAGLAPSWWAARARRDVDRPCPSAEVRSHCAWARVWDKPRAAQWDGHESGYQVAVADWERAHGMAQLGDELRRREADAQRERQAAEAAQREAAAAQLKAELRDRFLRLPGSTPEQFEAQYPTLLADHHRREMERLERGDPEVRQELRRSIEAGMSRAS